MNPMFLAQIALGAAELVLFLAWGFFLLLGVLLFAFWLWMLIHALRNKGLTDGERIAWVVVVCLTHALGALLYFFLGRPKAKVVPAAGSPPPAAAAPPPAGSAPSSASVPPAATGSASA